MWCSVSRRSLARAVVSRTARWSWSVRVFDQHGTRWGTRWEWSTRLLDYDMFGPRWLVVWRARRKVREVVRLVEWRRESFTVRP